MRCGGSPDVVAIYSAKSCHTVWAVGPHPPPMPSATIGMKSMPSARQSVSVVRWARLNSSQDVA
eukprot:6534286-Karenia_brevis.AAC.1